MPTRTVSSNYIHVFRRPRINVYFVTVHMSKHWTVKCIYKSVLRMESWEWLQQARGKNWRSRLLQSVLVQGTFGGNSFVNMVSQLFWKGCKKGRTALVLYLSSFRGILQLMFLQSTNKQFTLVLTYFHRYHITISDLLDTHTDTYGAVLCSQLFPR